MVMLQFGGSVTLANSLIWLAIKKTEHRSDPLREGDPRVCLSCMVMNNA